MNHEIHGLAPNSCAASAMTASNPSKTSKAGKPEDIRITHSVTEAWTVWRGDIPVAVYSGSNGRELAEQARQAILEGAAGNQLPADQNLGELTPLEQIKREAAHWDGLWDIRDTRLPLADRLLQAATEAGENKEPETMFQLLCLSRDALRHERKSRYSRRYKKSGATRVMSREQVVAATTLRSHGMSWGRIAEVMGLNRSTVRAAVLAAADDGSGP